MTISYNLGFDPIWYIADNVGRPLGGGYLATYSSLNPTVVKNVFMDVGGQQVWGTSPIPNSGSGQVGILFDENGQQGPFYFKFDSVNPNDLYDLFVYDSNGNLVWTVEDYIPGTGTGGSIVTTATNITNLLTNNVFWRHIDTQAPVPALVKIAPGAHSAFAATPANANPDIYFIKGNTSATDSLSFPVFTPYGANNFATGNDIQPVDYLLYTCSIAGTNEGSKVVQIPITQNVANLSNVAVTFKFWANGFSGTTVVTPTWWQFFGDGTNSPTAPIPTPFAAGPLTIAPGWNPYVLTSVIPSVALTPVPAVVGNCHNDGLFFQLGLPVNALCSIGLTKPAIYIGTIVPGADYQTHDQIDGVINAPRTGHTVSGLDAAAPPGYLAMNDQTIGSSASGAIVHNDSTFPLYNLIWNATNANGITQSWAPVTGGRGTSAINDFGNNKPMQILYALGAVIGNTGQATPSTNGYGPNTLAFNLAQPFGTDQIALLASQLPPHVHTYNSPGPGGTLASGTPFGAVSQNTGPGPGTSALVIIDQPTLRLNYFIKL